MSLRIGICSFSFHHLLAAGQQDIFQYIATCRELGCTQLDPWNAHLAPLKDGDNVLHAGHHPSQAQLGAGEDDYIDRVKAAADTVGLPFGCIAVDGTWVYDADGEKMQRNRQLVYRWIEIAARLGAAQIRIDAGGPADMPELVFEQIVNGYNDIIARAAAVNVQVLVENHWGPTPNPDNVIRLLDAVPGLGLLFDTNNWAPGRQDDGFRLCASRADACHVKLSTDLKMVQATPEKASQGIRALLAADYDGCWGVESYAHDPAMDEVEHAKQTINLIRQTIASKGTL